MKGTGVQKLLPQGRELLRGKTLSERGVLLRDCLLLLCGGFLFSGAEIHGEALPLAACLIAAQPFGLRAIFTAIGACVGYFFRCDGAEAAELIALCMMSLAQSAVFQGTSLPRFRWFYPCLTAGVCAVLSGVGLLGGEGAVTLWAARVLLAGVGCAVFRSALRGNSTARLLLTAALAAGASPLVPQADLGLFCAVALCCARQELLPAAVMGIALDVFGAQTHATVALLLPAVLCRRLSRAEHRALCTLCFALLPNLIFALFGEAGAGSCMVICAGAALGMLARQVGWYEIGAEASDAAGASLENAAQVLELLRSRLPQGAENPSASEAESVYDGAAERVCRCCARFHRCWEHRAEETYEALTGAARRIIERGAAEAEDFPQSFRDNCCHMEGFVTAINGELEGMLFRRRYRMELQESRRVIEQELGYIAEYLRTMRSQKPVSKAAELSFVPEVGICSVGKNGNRVNGDRGACFRGARGDYFVLLCDGMGTGADASRLSAETVQLLEQLLRAGLAPEAALQIYNGAEVLRGTDRFTTIDLLCLDLFTGDAVLYKWGSAPSYWRDKCEAKKIGTAAPPPGVGVGGENTPERHRLSLKRGEMLVLVSDGAGGAQTEAAIAAYSGESARELAALLISGLPAEDDMTAVVISLRPCTS